MLKCNLPYTSLALTLLTLGYSTFVAYQLTGSALGDVKVIQLEAFGGIRISHLRDGEIWRCFTAQLLHAKAIHMLYNCLALAFLGGIIEPRIGPLRLLAIWFFAGGAATVFSSLFGTPPWNLGTGASQAICALAGLSLVIYYKARNPWLLIAAGFALIPALGLDLITAGYPKPGHSLGFCLGLISYFLLPRKAATKSV